jgi:hypothetical protein
MIQTESEGEMIMDADEYIKERVEDQIRWLSDKSRWSQCWFKKLRAVEIVLGCAIAFLVGYADAHAAVKVAAGVLGVLIAAIGGLLSLYRFQENWVEFRVTAESLRREKFLFLTQAQPYNGEERFQFLVSRVENILGAENAKWGESASLKPPDSSRPPNPLSQKPLSHD